MASDPSRVDKWFAVIKNNPVVAIVIVVAVSYLAIVSWLNKAADESGKLLSRAGIGETAAEHSAKRISYRLGKEVASLSYLKTAKEKIGASFDSQGEEANKEGELKSYLGDLQINVEQDKLDFVSRVIGNYQDSSAASFLKEQVQLKHGDEAGKAYELGLELEGYRWVAFSKHFSLPDSNVGEDAFIVLKALSEMARHFGADGVSEGNLEGSDLSGFNISMRLLIEQLERQVEARI